MAYDKPELRERIKKRIMCCEKGGRAVQWSARKAQLLAQEYEKAGGGYSGAKTAAQKDLTKWTNEEWRTKSGKPSVQGKNATGERYLPKKAIQQLSDAEYKATTKKKKEATAKGKQFASNTTKAKSASRRARSS